MMRLLVRDKNDGALVAFNVIEAYDEPDKGVTTLVVLSDTGIPVLNGETVSQVITDTIQVSIQHNILPELVANGFCCDGHIEFEWVDAGVDDEE